MGSFDLKLYHLRKINGKAENYGATRASTADFNQVEEYESDSDDNDNDVDIESDELVIGQPIMTRSGQGLMFRRAQNGKPGHTNLLIKALRFI